MSEWKVLVTPQFQNEVRDIHRYIQSTLLNPDAAIKQTQRIIETAKGLKNMPERNPLYPREPWQSRGLRKIVVDNYVIFYLVNVKSNEVVVLHVFYGGRNIDAILDQE